jgi:hypothetical protein
MIQPGASVHPVCSGRWLLGTSLAGRGYSICSRAAGAGHGISVDQEQNLYRAAVGRGAAQKFRPRQGANPAYLVGKHVYSAWK